MYEQLRYLQGVPSLFFQKNKVFEVWGSLAKMAGGNIMLQFLSHMQNIENFMKGEKFVSESGPLYDRLSNLFVLFPKVPFLTFQMQPTLYS